MRRGSPCYLVKTIIQSEIAKNTSATFSRRGPDILAEELVAQFSKKTSYEFKQLFDLIFANLRARKAASGGEEMLRLRAYEKLQSLVGLGVVKKTIANGCKTYQGVASPLQALSAQMKTMREEWNARLAANSDTP